MRPILPASIIAGSLAPVSSASIVYRDIPDVQLTASSALGDNTVTATLNIDTGQSAGLVFSIYSHREPVFGNTALTAYLTHLAGMGTLNQYRPPSNANACYPMGPGDLIGIGTQVPPTWHWDTSSTDIRYLASYSNFGEGGSFGFWAGNGYLGISIPVAGGARYGWVGMFASTGLITIRDFAFETTVNTPIEAGAVPSPTALSCMALAGLACHRRRSL